LWIALWIVIGKVNLIAVPLLWWTWKIGNQLSRPEPSRDDFLQKGPPQNDIPIASDFVQ